MAGIGSCGYLPGSADPGGLLTPRRAALLIVAAMDKAAQETWDQLQNEFPNDVRDEMKGLVWEHVKTRYGKNHDGGKEVKAG